MSKPLSGWTLFAETFESSTKAENPATIGCYIRLLNYQFSNGKVPIKDRDRVWSICGITPSLAEVVSFEYLESKFPKGINEKMQNTIDWHKVQREKKKKAAEKRWSKKEVNVNEIEETDARALQVECLKDSDSDSIYLSKTDTNIVAPTLDELKEHCIINAPYVNPNTMYWHFDATGWKDKGGKCILKTWKRSASTWNEREVRSGNSRYVEPIEKKQRFNCV